MINSIGCLTVIYDIKRLEKKSHDKKTWEEVETELLESLDKKELAKKPLTETIKNLVGFHRREQKPEWWEIFDRMEKTHDELEDDEETRH